MNFAPKLALAASGRATLRTGPQRGPGGKVEQATLHARRQLSMLALGTQLLALLPSYVLHHAYCILYHEHGLLSVDSPTSITS